MIWCNSSLLIKYSQCYLVGECRRLKRKLKRGPLLDGIIGSKTILCSSAYICEDWLESIEVMCNEIIGNFIMNEDQLMIVAFDGREKQRLNRQTFLFFDHDDDGYFDASDLQ